MNHTSRGSKETLHILDNNLTIHEIKISSRLIMNQYCIKFEITKYFKL